MLFVTPGNDATQTQGYFLKVLDVSLCVPVSMGLFICGIIVFLEVNLDEIIVAQSRHGIPARDSQVYGVSLRMRFISRRRRSGFSLMNSWVRPWDGAMFPKLGNVCRWNESHQNCVFKAPGRPALWVWDCRQNVKECVRTGKHSFGKLSFTLPLCYFFSPPHQSHN